MKQLHRSGRMNNNQFSLQNIFISSFFCILVGTILFINSKSILWSSASVTVFIAGIILMVIGLILKISITMDTKKILHNFLASSFSCMSSTIPPSFSLIGPVISESISFGQLEFSSLPKARFARLGL